MRHYEVRSTRALRRTVPVALLGGVAVLTLLLASVLLPGRSEGSGPYFNAFPTFKIAINYDGACDAGTIQESISSSETLPAAVNVSGSIEGCIGTETAPGTVLIDDELLDYANIWTTTRATQTNLTQAISAAASLPFDISVNTTVNAPSSGQLRIGGEILSYDSLTSSTFHVNARGLSGTEASSHNIGADVAAGQEVAPFQSPVFNLYVSSCNDSEFANSGSLYVGTELVAYTSKTCDGVAGSPDFFVISSRGDSSQQHLVSSFVRAEGTLRIIARQQSTYLDGTTSPPGTVLQSHSIGAAIGSPQTYHTCRARLEEDGNNITLRSRCYTILEPGYSPPSQLPWPDPLPLAAPRLALTPFFFHDITRGTIDQGSGLVAVTTEFLGFSCFPFVTDELWIKVEQTIDLDKTTGPGDTDIGSFLIKVYDDNQCTNQVDQLGQAGNLVAEEIASGVDTDGDGCSDYEELGTNQNLGGARDPFNPWDFYDINGDKVVTIPDDILGVASNFGPVPPADPAADRGQRVPDPAGLSAQSGSAFRGPGPETWNRNRGDGVVTIPDDILGVAGQFGHNCSFAPN